MMGNMTTVSFDVPSELARLITSAPSNGAFERNAMLLYPFIQNLTISHGKAAEILGVHKLDLIAFYGKLGLPYLDLSEDELAEERAVFQRAKGSA
jgi:hypothetical protein